MKNEMAKRLDSIVGPGTARLAQVAVAGRAAGGAVTRASWGEHLSSLSRHEGEATAAMSIMPTLNMFPALERDCTQAGDAGLPTDVVSMQARALHAYPYHPTYWTDIGDRIGAQYEWPDAFLLFDVAFSLPMPQALADSRVLEGKRESIKRFRRDFPDAFLPR